MMIPELRLSSDRAFELCASIMISQIAIPITAPIRMPLKPEDMNCKMTIRLSGEKKENGLEKRFEQNLKVTIEKICEICYNCLNKYRCQDCV